MTTTLPNVPFPPSFPHTPLHLPPSMLRAVHERLTEPDFNIGYTTTSKPVRSGMFKSSKEEISRFQFWPNTISMGSLVGNKFTQNVALQCKLGDDPVTRRRYCYLSFDFERELLALKATFLVESKLPPAMSPLDAELPFDDITSQGIHIHEGPYDPSDYNGRRQVTVTISCKRPPKFKIQFQDPDDPCYDERYATKRRATAMDFALTDATERDAGPIPAIPDGPPAYPTFWNTYRWDFLLPDKEVSKFRACAHKIRLLGTVDSELSLLSTRSAAWESRLAQSVEFRPDLHHMPDISGLEFSTRALIEGLVAHGIIVPAAVNELLEALKKYAVVPFFRDRVLESLWSEERVRNPEAVVRGKARFLRRATSIMLPHLVMIRTVIVTPTRVLSGPLQQEPSNSVTRKYSRSLDAIIRVNFTDEEDRLHTKQADSLYPNVGPMARVRRALQHGIVIGGRRFLPVASSSSQQNVIDIRELKSWMGDVAETVVAKHAARMGLPFSTSRSVEFDVTVLRDLADIERNGNCFTDGCGLAGKEIMREAAIALGTTVGVNSTPSCIQFRLGGAKGVLSYWPGRVGDHEIRLRKSQVKFDSNLTDLNVVRLAKYQVAFLNRQFILMMCANGVPEQLMLELFDQNLRTIKGLVDRVSSNAITKEDKGLLSQVKDFPLITLIKNGFNQDPLVLDIVRIIECRTLQDLKWRARLRLSGGVFLIGIADESGILKEGEIFCQYQESSEKTAVIVQSEVVICRAPALHPGDVRRAFAVDVPELHHLKNVIVFSIQGARDLPNMLGGGDLDGDDYTLIWDQRFVKTLRVFPPMDYTAPPPKRVARVTQQDLNENFVQFMLNDILGQVDNCHLGLADQSGPFDPRCLKLSEIHSTAVDFAKTGQAANIPKDLRPQMWPDFMDKDPEKTYLSQGILGQLFRLVHPEPHFTPSDLKELRYPVDQRLSRYPIYPKLMQNLRPIKAHYDHAIEYDMRKYRVLESEIPAGIALKNKHRKRAKDQNLNEPLQDEYKIQVANARQACLNEVSRFNFPTVLSPAHIVARHCYALTYERQYAEEWEKEILSGLWGGHGDEEEINELRQGTLKSFAWVFWQELVELASPDLMA